MPLGVFPGDLEVRARRHAALARPHPVVLGAAAVHYDGPLEWDDEKGEITNVPEANKWVKPTYRKGWEMKL